MIKPAYTNLAADKDENAKFKLFSMLSQMQKLKIQEYQKGFSSEKNLWLHDVAYLVYKTLKD